MTETSSAAWYVRRLQRMGPAEIVRRVEALAWRQLWSRQQVLGWENVTGVPRTLVGQPSFTSVLAPSTRDNVPLEAAKEVVRAADRVLDGDWEVFGLARRDIAEPDWFRDDMTGVRAPSRPLAFTINHRDETQVGNIKALWEVSRHHHLTLLAAAWWVSGDERYAKAVELQLRSWWGENAFLSGVHWTSGIEIGVRLISWAWIRRLLDGWNAAADLFEHNGQALWQLWWHQRYLSRFRSRGSSANNHVVAEAAGLLVGACAFPWFAESGKWRRDACALLEEEFARNTFPSGVNRELASEYHGFVAELTLVAAVECAGYGFPVSPELWAGLGRAFDAAAALVDVAGRPPRQGDGDDGRALLLDPPESGSWRHLIGVGSAVFGPASWWPEGTPSVAATVLRGLIGGPVSVTHRDERPDRFPEAGITLLRTRQGEEPEIWCRCDSGPHGFLSIAAHAHADALSVELRYDGVDVFADPGTYCYHGEPEWRAYFRSTLAHNTLEVAGESQSVSGGPFLWTRHATTTQTMTGVQQGPVLRWSAEHAGYERLATPVTHRRDVDLDLQARQFSVDDHVLTDAPVEVRLVWHLGPDIKAQVDDNTVALAWSDRGEDRSAAVRLPERLDWTTARGETDPVLGWYSPSFGRKTETTTLLGRGVVTSCTLTTLVVFDPPWDATNGAPGG